MMNKHLIFLLPLFIALSSCDSSTDIISSSTVGLEQIYNSGYIDGYNDAKQDYSGNKYESGYNDGFADGYNKGLEDGKDQEINASIRPGNNLNIHTDSQAKYILDDPYNIGKYASGTQEICLPNVFNLSFEDINFGVDTNQYIVNLSETEDFSVCEQYITNQKQLNITNLKLNTSYYWNVSIQKDDIKYISQTFSFSTRNDIIRNICVPGSTNWRDLGNYQTIDGKTIKQGLIYRSAAFGFSNGTTSNPTQEGIDVIKNQLKIKSDIDLTGVNGIDGINRYFYRMEYSNIDNLIDDEGNKSSIKNVFEVLGDENNYPAVFHCTRGRDRTGAVAFLLGGYLGMSKDDLVRDYLFTNFSSSNTCSSSVINNYFSYMENNFEGPNLKEQIKNYLLSIGVTMDVLNNITNILVQ